MNYYLTVYKISPFLREAYMCIGKQRLSRLIKFASLALDAGCLVQ